MTEHRIIAYTLWIALCFLFFAKKPKNFDSFAGKMMAWWCFPLVYILFIVAGYLNRNKLRWIKSKWLLVSLHMASYFLICGFEEKTKHGKS